MVLVGSDAYPDISINATPSLSSDEVLNIAKSNFAGLSGKDSVEIRKDPELIILPVENDLGYDYFLTYNIELEFINSASVFSEAYFIDAKNGNIVRQYSNIRDASLYGTVSIRYWPDHYDDSTVVSGAEHERVRLYNYLGQYVGTRYTSSSGYYNFSGVSPGSYRVLSRLEGRYLRLYQNNENHDVWVGTGIHNWTWNATDATNVYYHANWIHDFFKSSPFNYNAMDYQMRAYVNEGPDYNGWSDGINIGFGSENGQQFARSSDAVYHEYSHSTAYHLYGNRWIGYVEEEEGWAMDEGLADYFACSMLGVTS